MNQDVSASHSSPQDDAARARRAVYAVMLLIAVGVGVGKIASVDSARDRAIQNLRLQQLDKEVQDKSKELAEKNLAPDEFEAQLERFYKARLADALKARPTLSANDRSRWATIRALVEKDARVWRYLPVASPEFRAERAKNLKDLFYDDAQEFAYMPGEVLRNCADDCPEKFDQANRKRLESVFGEKIVFRKELVPYAIDKAWETPGWESIDVVKHGLPDELWNPADPASGYLYSSKPPLLPTVMAAPYWVLNRCFGMSLVKQPFECVKILLVVYNLIPLAIAWLCLASTIESLGRTFWARVFAFAVALFASFALTFVATLNNHVPGFACICVALWASFKILREDSTRKRHFAIAGFFAAFAVACELPALAFAALMFLCLLVKRPGKTLLVGLPAGLIVVAAFFATNYVAHKTFSPAYAHKRAPEKIEAAATPYPLDVERLAARSEMKRRNENPELFETVPSKRVVDLAALPDAPFSEKDWYFYNYYPSGRPRALKYARLSHWANRTGIDRGEPSIARYAFHSTIGLRGVFSLTPAWLLSLLGILAAFFARRRENEDGVGSIRVAAFVGLALTIVFFAFFLTRNQWDRNYGGVSCCPRWFFPLAPIYVLCMLPALDRFGRKRAFQAFACACLAWSVASAFYPTWNPWVDPWLYQLAVDWNLATPY